MMNIHGVSQRLNSNVAEVKGLFASLSGRAAEEITINKTVMFSIDLERSIHFHSEHARQVHFDRLDK